jgi:hypothetical protein
MSSVAAAARLLFFVQVNIFSLCTCCAPLSGRDSQWGGGAPKYGAPQKKRLIHSSAGTLYRVHQESVRKQSEIYW